MCSDPILVYEQDDMAIFFSEAILISGYNVYKKNLNEGIWEKLNPEFSFFITFEAAKKFLEAKVNNLPTNEYFEVKEAIVYYE